MVGTARARVTSRGRVTIPKVVRDGLGFRPGNTLVFELKGGRAEVRAERRGTIADLAGLFPIKNATGMLRGGPSLTRALLKERRGDQTREVMKRGRGSSRSAQWKGKENFSRRQRRRLGNPSGT
jgi:AbrB family looped-hinge helix DNA binding protein